MKLLFERINPTDRDRLARAYNRLVMSCDAFKYLHYNKFLNYRDGILVSRENKSIYDRIDSRFAIIGVRRVIAKELGLTDLPYHCAPKDIVNEIGFIHYFDPYNKMIETDKKDILKHMVNTMLIDKNDTHSIIFKYGCPECDNYSYLTEAGFELIDDDNGAYFLRQPITQ